MGHPLIVEGDEPKSAFFSSFSCRRQASLLKSETGANHSKSEVTQAIQRRLIGYSVEVFTESLGENAGTVECTSEESDRGMEFQIVGVAEDVVNGPVR
jgi:hypothetical protein